MTSWISDFMDNMISWISFVCFFISRTATSFRRSYIDTLQDYNNFTSRIFCSWDFGIMSHTAAKLRHRTITTELKVMRLLFVLFLFKAINVNLKRNESRPCSERQILWQLRHNTVLRHETSIPGPPIAWWPCALSSVKEGYQFMAIQCRKTFWTRALTWTSFRQWLISGFELWIITVRGKWKTFLCLQLKVSPTVFNNVQPYAALLTNLCGSDVLFIAWFFYLNNRKFMSVTRKLISRKSAMKSALRPPPLPHKLSELYFPRQEILAERQRKTESRSFNEKLKMFALRLFNWTICLGLIGGSMALVYYVNYSFLGKIKVCLNVWCRKPEITKLLVVSEIISASVCAICVQR